MATAADPTPRATLARVSGWVRRRSGVRVRSALAATVVVAVALAVAAGAFVWFYRGALLQSIDDTASQRAQTVAADLRRDGFRPNPVVPAAPGEQTVVQVLDPAGRVVAASGDIAGESPMSGSRPRAGAEVRTDHRLPFYDDRMFHIVALGVGGPGGTYTVLVGQALGPLDASIREASALLLIGSPLLLLVVGAATFWFVGRSLRPVEGIRREVTGITASQLHARVPVPEARDEVARLAETMNAMLDRLEAAVGAQHRFVADAGHELRSPLATVQAGLELLRARPLPDPATATVEMLQAEAARLDRLVSGLVLLARADENGLRPRLTDVDLDDLADAERSRLASQHPDLVRSVHIEPVQVRGDAHQLAQVFRNLTDNAARHAASTIRLRVTSDPSAGAAVVEVSDDGPGVPVADRARIFERFVRLDDSRHRASGGTGLGLAIVQEVVASHGGTVSVAEAPGGGAVFAVRLPLGGPTGRNGAVPAGPSQPPSRASR
jgi:signal transduction histidine kinase